MKVVRFGQLLLVALLAVGLNVAAAAEHWAYVAPTRPALPSAAQNEWTTSAIDRFILARLEREGLKPKAEANRATLLRRVTLVLTGLPPTPEEHDAFLADQSPDAYERVVDRLLASPRYGEHMAVAWLDLARYADTHGYHSDSERTMWRWRDWVIDALNKGMPYDQFSIEQLAGDLLPNPTLEQRIATGFHRNHMLNDENGAIPEEFLSEYIVDRVSTTGAVWLGQTFACARCHDHKYDPLTQREFFQLYAFFNVVPENGLGGKTGNSPPTMAAPTREQQRQLTALAAEIGRLERQLAQREKQADRDFAAWEAKALVGAKSFARPPADAVIHLPLDETSGDTAHDVAHQRPPGRVKGNPTWAGGKLGGSLLCDGTTYVEIPTTPKWDRSDDFSIAAWIFPTTSDTMTIAGSVDEPQARRGYELGLAQGKLFLRLTHVAEKNEVHVTTNTPLKRGWHSVAAVYDGSGAAAGVTLYVDGVVQQLATLQDSLSGHILGDQPLIAGRGDSVAFFRGLLDDVQLFDRALSAAEAKALAGGDPIQEILATSRRGRTAEQQATLRKHYLENHDPIYRRTLNQLRTQQLARETVSRAIPTTMVMEEMPTPRPTFVLKNGLYDQPGDQVAAATPAYLPAMPNQPRNRLALAKWLFDPQQPLTSRVAANRAWQSMFRAGLVRTPDDFGLRGEPPSHPELLDWLACEHALDWDTKRLHRLIVTSATFRQSSRVEPRDLAIDPENRLLARGPRYRLPAEVVRDQSLAAAGLLDLRLGGPSVKPYQPAELWRELAYDPNDYSAQVFVQSHGADLYRRSLYTFWKRAAPPPNLATLDAPDRETCTATRSRSSTLLQALVLLNDTTFVEAARRLAERVLTEPRQNDESRLQVMVKRLLGRHATSAETAVLLRQLETERSAFGRDKQSAEELLSVGELPPSASIEPLELAAWTMIASALLNLDETVSLR